MSKYSHFKLILIDVIMAGFRTKKNFKSLLEKARGDKFVESFRKTDLCLMSRFSTLNSVTLESMVVKSLWAHVSWKLFNIL